MPRGIAEVKALQALVASIEPDIRFHIRIPFGPITVQTLQDVVQDLARKLREIAAFGLTICPGQITEAEELLESLEDYRLLAEQYYDPVAEEARRKRPLYKVAPDIELISRSAKDLKRSLLGYLLGLQQCLAELP